MRLTVVRGIPGSGKSTYSHKHFQCLILENDMFQIVNNHYWWSPEGTKMAIAMVRKIAEMTLAHGADVCVCNTFTKKKFIEGYQKLAEEYGADFEVIRCTGEFKNIHNVPPQILANMKSGFEDWDGEKIIVPEQIA